MDGNIQPQMSETSDQGETYRKDDSTKGSDISKSIGVPGEKKRVYRSIFGPQSTSESDSDSDFLCAERERYSLLESLQKIEFPKVSNERSGNLMNVNTLSEPGESCSEQLIDDTYNEMESTKLSHEEKERFETIAKELDILNTQSAEIENHFKGTKLYTGPYGRILSPFKKFSSFSTAARGIKRSPRKLPIPKSKRVKLQDDSSETSESGDTTPEKSLILPSSSMESPDALAHTMTDDSSEEDQWEIIEESETELDKELDFKSGKFSLSTINVKSIIHKIITNEGVVEMVRKAVQQELNENDEKFEPKMTRSKVKEVYESQGTTSLPWGLSPVKKKQDAASFLDIDLPEEEEDDEDFNPDKVAEQESDEDSESVMSSCVSDIGSPMPSTPSTSCPTPSTSSYRARTPSAADSDNSSSFLSPMGPPLQIIVPRSYQNVSSIGRKFHDAMEKNECMTAQEEKELIASRTRSKFPLKDMSILDIEANFVAPDITEDLYDTSCDDHDWRDFLKTLVKADTTITEDSPDMGGEEEDPEYNFLEEAEEAEYDQEDFRDDRAVKVSKKELNLLIDELNDAYGESDPLDDECKHTIMAESEKIVFTKNKKAESKYQQNLVMEIGDYERRQIDDQLRKHIQLLAQTFVLAQNGEAEHVIIADTAKMYITELQHFAERSELMYPTTILRVANLQESLTIINDANWHKPLELPEEYVERLEDVVFKHKYDSQNLPRLSYRQMVTLWTNPAFMYPELLPHGGFFRTSQIKKDRARVKFIETEDNLLAMGMDQFRDLSDAKDYIHKFMLPCKTKKQISIRIKNLSAKSAKDNPVKFWKTFKRLPQFPQFAPYFDISMMKAPQDSDADAEDLPAWCWFFRCDENPDISVLESIREARVKRNKEKQSINYCVSGPDISSLCTPPSSAPVTPVQQVDGSLKGSSASSDNSVISSETIPKKRRKQAYKKKLVLGNQKNGTAQGAFVPLPLSNCSSKSRNSPITICVLDKLSATSALSYGINSTGIANQGSVLNPAVTCVAPTIILINNTAPVQVLSSTQPAMNLASTPISIATPISMTMAQNNLAALSTASTEARYQVYNEEKLIEKREQILPILDSNLNNNMEEQGIEDTTLTSLSLEKSLQMEQTLTSFPLSASSEDATLNESTDISSNHVQSMPNFLSTTESEEIATTLESEVIPVTASCMTETELATQFITVQSSQIWPTPDSVTCDSQPVSAISSALTAAILDRSMAVEGRCTPGVESNSTCESDQITPETGQMTPKTGHMTPKSNSMTPQSGHITPKQLTPTSSVASCNGTPKNVLEVMASYAPYFISPINKIGIFSAQQQSQETTPKKKQGGYVSLAPKPTSPSSTNHVNPLLPKIKSSLRRKQLNEKVKSILPKGFVLRTFETSPSKKVASDLVDKAIKGRKPRSSNSFSSSLGGFHKILPNPYTSPVSVQSTHKELEKISSNQSVSEKRDENSSQKDTAESGIDKQESELFSDDMGDDDIDRNENNNTDIYEDDDDNHGDTESDYTQSEDGNDTQEEGDSQEDLDSHDEGAEDDDNHIASLMQASTTVGFDPGKDDVCRGRLGKKDRDRDVTLAMLAPDIVESDPLRDDRDTGFAQAYLHKVKKTLKDDMDTLEKFLHIMYNFSKTNESPLKLYKELSELFMGYPDLMHDFSGFLLPQQAKECDCYDAYQEFNNARHFLRKLEIYFCKTPHQFQKLMKILSRWYKKPGRNPQDLRDQVDPVLKGQRYLLEEFSRFFPNEQPPESLMEDFEEVNLDSSGDDTDTKYDSFEEVELLDGEEVHGTKWCTCFCHDTGDDTYRKRKKHCYRCCLTVIDGELVYKVNKSTIKRINVTFGPAIKAGSLPPEHMDDPPIIHIKQEPECEECDPNMEPDETDWLLDTAAAEKENIEHYNDATSQTGEASTTRKSDKLKMGHRKLTDTWKKSSFLQRISKLSRSKPKSKQARLSSILICMDKGKSPSLSSVQSKSLRSNAGSSSSMNSSDSSPDHQVRSVNNENSVGDTQVKKSVSEYELQASIEKLECIASFSPEQNVTSGCVNVESTCDSDEGLQNNMMIKASKFTKSGEIKTSVSSIELNGKGSTNVQMELKENKQKSVDSEIIHQESKTTLSSLELVSSGNTFKHSEIKTTLSSLELVSSGKTSKHSEIKTTAFDLQLLKENDHTTMEIPTNSTQCEGTKENSSLEEKPKNKDIKVKLNDQDLKNSSNSDTSLANDILAKAFNSALMSEVSMDAVPLPFAMASESSVKKNTSVVDSEHMNISSIAASSENNSKVHGEVLNVASDLNSAAKQSQVVAFSPGLLMPKPAVNSTSSVAILAPIGQVHLNVSMDSSFSKVGAKIPHSEQSEKDVDGHINDPDKNIKHIDKSTIESMVEVEMKIEANMSPPFSPFSPFASEIQSITAQSPLACVSSPSSSVVSRSSCSTKVRRITPIPIKGGLAENSSFSSFETVVQNSPVLYETQITKSPFEKLQIEKSNSSTDVTLKYGLESMTIMKPGSTSLSNETHAGSSKSHSSDFKAVTLDATSATVPTSQRSEEMLSNSQQSDSQNSKSSDVPVANITISKPVTFSENANEGFPKTSKADSANSYILSDDSLFHCFEKPSHHVGESMHSISNLTNILHALDYKTQAVSFSKSNENELAPESKTLNQTKSEHVENILIGNEAAFSDQHHQSVALNRGEQGKNDNDRLVQKCSIITEDRANISGLNIDVSQLTNSPCRADTNVNTVAAVSSGQSNSLPKQTITSTVASLENSAQSCSEERKTKLQIRQQEQIDTTKHQFTSTGTVISPTSNEIDNDVEDSSQKITEIQSLVKTQKCIVVSVMQSCAKSNLVNECRIKSNAETKNINKMGNKSNDAIRTKSTLSESEDESSDSDEEVEKDYKVASIHRYYPQSVQSIENMERIKAGTFKISTLSDSGSSSNPTPSSSLTEVASSAQEVNLPLITNAAKFYLSCGENDDTLAGLEELEKTVVDEKFEKDMSDYVSDSEKISETIKYDTSSIHKSETLLPEVGMEEYVSEDDIQETEVSLIKISSSVATELDLKKNKNKKLKHKVNESFQEKGSLGTDEEKKLESDLKLQLKHREELKDKLENMESVKSVSDSLGNNLSCPGSLDKVVEPFIDSSVNRSTDVIESVNDSEVNVCKTDMQTNEKLEVCVGSTQGDLISVTTEGNSDIKPIENVTEHENVKEILAEKCSEVRELTSSLCTSDQNRSILGINTEPETKEIKKGEETEVKQISDTEYLSKSKKKSKHKHKDDKKHKKKKKKDDIDSDTSLNREKKKKSKKSRNLERDDDERQLYQSESSVFSQDSDTSQEPDKCLNRKDFSASQAVILLAGDKMTPDAVTCKTGDQQTALINNPERTPDGPDLEVRAEEPLWSKETDKTILEKCKKHGAKEKTFAKIAKQFGNVTIKQVRKRYKQLYQFIFSSQIDLGQEETE